MRPDRSWALAPALLLCACVQDEGVLSSLQEAYGAQSVDVMEAPLSSTLLVSGLAVDLCLSARTGAWDAADPGEVPPLGPEIQLALGSPTVGAAQTVPNLTGSLLDVSLLGRSDAVVNFSAVEGSPFLVTGAVADGADGGSLGIFSISVVGGCTTTFARVTGTATWTDDDGLEHSLRMPAGDSEGDGLDFPGAAVWLPSTGTLSWQARIDEELRSFVADDASGIEVDGAGGLWSGTMSGREWEVQVEAALQPQ